jgi:Microfibril-associated/Pre-mRNA processing
VLHASLMSLLTVFTALVGQLWLSEIALVTSDGSASQVCTMCPLILTTTLLQRETRELVIQRLEQERAESEAANAGPVGVDDINTDDEVPCPGCVAVPQCCCTGAMKWTPMFIAYAGCSSFLSSPMCCTAAAQQQSVATGRQCLPQTHMSRTENWKHSRNAVVLTRHPHFSRWHRSTHARDLLTQVEEEGQTREYNAWEQRERARVANDRAEREKEAREAGERERLKNMSEEERRQWERENPKVTRDC